MDLQYISANKLLILYGFFGTIIYIIICLITTDIKCEYSSPFSYSNSTENYNKNYLCKVPFHHTVSYCNSYYNLTEDETIYYLDNFGIYFKTFEYSNTLEIFKEIIIIFIAGITYFYYKYYSLMIIKFLSPIHYVFSNQIFFSITKLLLPIYTLINTNKFFNKNLEFIIPKYILDTSAYFLSIIGFLVFLEIIELNFYDLNKDLRRKISDRSEDESLNLLEDNFDDDDDSNDDNKEN